MLDPTPSLLLRSSYTYNNLFSPCIKSPSARSFPMSILNIFDIAHLLRGLPCGTEVKASAFNVQVETWVQSLGREDPLEKAMATHSSNDLNSTLAFQ